MVTSYGMSEALGPVAFDEGKASPFLETGLSRVRGNYSEALARRIDQEVRHLLEAQQLRVRELLGAREATLRKAAEQLLERETLSGEELAELIASPGEQTPAAEPRRDAA
jgi:cell division protease FtsH